MLTSTLDDFDFTLHIYSQQDEARTKSSERIELQGFKSSTRFQLILRNNNLTKELLSYPSFGALRPEISRMQSGGGGGGSTGPGLPRYCSAPATWLEALLEDEEEDPLKQHHCLTQLLSDNPQPPLSRASVGLATPSELGLFESGTGFLRQNSSPADFLGSSAVDSDGYYSSYRNLDFASPNINGSYTGKRQREQISYQLKREQDGDQDLETENLLEGEDSASFRIRAKRGCATHPRSIAERVRRTKISDRIRKLQELVPNMDKQTNTADMLDEAVEYVKLLQKQIQELSEQQKSCKCIATDQKVGTH